MKVWIYQSNVIVTKSKNDWSVELNNSTLPKIIVNQEYIDEIESLKCSDNDKKFISENINSAKWLLKAIEQRNITTLKISSEIVNQQREFLKRVKSFKTHDLRMSQKKLICMKVQ